MAGVLCLVVEELNLSLEAEESLISLALSQGFTIQEFARLMDVVHLTTVEIATADGINLYTIEKSEGKCLPIFCTFQLISTSLFSYLEQL